MSASVAAFSVLAVGCSPGISSISPSTGPIAGGTAVTISGKGFTSGAKVTIGSADCGSATVTGSTTITCTTAAVSTAGKVDVVVKSADNFSSTLTGGFTYTSGSSATVAISPTTASSAVSGSATTFTASGGVPPYTFSVVSGGVGTVAAAGTTGASYSPPTSGAGGTATVRVTDSGGTTADAVVTVAAALAVSPATKTLSIGGSAQAVTITGGVSPYSYTLVGAGTFDSTTIKYTPPSTGSASTATLTIVDSGGATATATFTLTAGVAFTSSSLTTAASGSAQTFSVTGGQSPYTFSITASTATGTSITSSTSTSATLTPSTTAGSATLTVTDALGSTATATLTVNAAFAISPSTDQTASVLPGSQAATVVLNIVASGGVAPYGFTAIAASKGTLAAKSGTTDTFTWTPPNVTGGGTAGAATVTITDSAGGSKSFTLTLNSAITATPAAATVPASATNAAAATGSGVVVYTAANGATPYTFSLVSGSGTFSGTTSTTGTYNAPAPASGLTASQATVRVKDLYGGYVDNYVDVVVPMKVAAGAAHSCAMFSNSRVKCWGDNSFAQLGVGTLVAATTNASANITYASGFTPIVGQTISGPGVPWGTRVLGINGTTFTLSANASATAGAAKLTANLGEVSGTMGTYLPWVNTGTKDVIDIVAGKKHTCVLRVDGSVKCWGDNTWGQIGIGSNPLTDPRDKLGDDPGEMGETGIIDLFVLAPKSRKFKALAAGGDQTCGILQDTTGANPDSLVCWGANSEGQAGVNCAAYGGANSAHICTSPCNNATGCAAGAETVHELGAATTTHFGAGRYPLSVSTNGGLVDSDTMGWSPNADECNGKNCGHTCVILDNDKVSCWGYNGNGDVPDGPLVANPYAGQLGLNSTTDQALPDEINTVLSMGSKRAVAIGAGMGHTCMVMDDFSFTCWGVNQWGQLGRDTTVGYGYQVAVTEVQTITGAPTTAPVKAGGCWKITWRGMTTGCLDGNATAVTVRTALRGLHPDLSGVNVGLAGNWALPVYTITFDGNSASQDVDEMTVSNTSVVDSSVPTVPVTYTVATTTPGVGLPTIQYSTITMTAGSVLGAQGGLDHTCILSTSGALMCFGRNNYGQIAGGVPTLIRGDSFGDMSLVSTIDFQGKTVSSYATGWFHNCVILNDTSVRCWGRNDKGQLGYQTIVNRGDTLQSSPDHRFSSIAPVAF